MSGANNYFRVVFEGHARSLHDTHATIFPFNDRDPAQARRAYHAAYDLLGTSKGHVCAWRRCEGMPGSVYVIGDLMTDARAMRGMQEEAA